MTCNLCNDSDQVACIPHGRPADEAEFHRCPVCLEAELKTAIVPTAAYTTQEAAALLDVHPDTLNSMFRNSVVPACRIGTSDKAPWRVSGQALIDWMNPPAKPRQQRRGRQRRPAKT